jgi:hypothetical protein
MWGKRDGGRERSMEGWMDGRRDGGMEIKRGCKFIRTILFQDLPGMIMQLNNY